MAADWMAGVLSGDGPDALSPMVVTTLPDPALPETGKRVIAVGRPARPLPRAGQLTSRSCWSAGTSTTLKRAGRPRP
jgi:hypothetical protein